MAISLFGPLTITAADGTPANMPTRKTALVFALLALLDEKGATREALAEWIWPDRSEGQARTSLRQALAAIRKALPGVLDGYRLETELDLVRLAGPEDLIDTRRFEALRQSPRLIDKARAAAIYGGDLLEGMALDRQLEDLVRSHRQQFRRQALALVEELSEEADLDDASRETCEALANRLLAADPAAEEAHRAIIRLRLADGQTNAARRQLESCMEAVSREFDAEPEEKTVALLNEPPRPAAAAAGALRLPADAPAEDRRPGVAPIERARPSLVVMPFDDLGSNEDDFFVDGVVEEITSALSRIREFFVIARQSAYTYKGRFVDVREVGRDLGVHYAVEGTVRRGGGRVRITVQLVETASGTQLWSERYEGDTANLFDLQDRIASHVAGAINPSVRASEIERARRTPPENLQAYDLVLRGLPHFWVHRKEDNRKALALFDDALGRDPDYGVALAFKAWCHAQEACYLWSDDPGRDRTDAVAAAEMAAIHVGDHATALVAIGAAVSITTTEHELAASFIDRGLAIDPNNAWGWMRSGWLKVLFSLRSDAIECFERALDLSPFDPFTFNIYFGMAAAHAEMGEMTEAIELVQRGLRAGPGVTWAYRMLASYYKMVGETEKSAEALQTFMRHYPGVTIEKMKQGLPPGLIVSNPNYWEGMRRAGIPER